MHRIISPIMATVSLIIAMVAVPAFAGDVSHSTPGISGYDPVAYFTDGQPVKGSGYHVAQHDGVTYTFASKEHKRMFEANPGKYVPAYGGWCATAMAKGEKVEIDPTNFKVTNGRLFLFYKAFYANAIKDWNKAEAALTARADAHWKKISGE